MNPANPVSGENLPVSSPESAAARQRRLVHEAEQIAAARASVAAGRTVSEAQVDAWIDSLGTDHALPAPRSGR